MRFFIITCFLITSFQSYSQGLKLIAPGLSAEIDYGSGSFSSFDAETGQEVSLHHFQSVGTSPQSSLLQIDGYLYGTTHQGGNYGDGTIFKVSTDGEEFLKLHDFEAGEGQWPNGVIQAADGFLYGMTQRGGPKNVYGTYGVIYKIKTDGSQFEVIHEFSGSRFDGREPLGDLIEGTDGKLYGMTQLGGYNTPNYVDAEGIIFRIDTDGGNFELLYDMKPETGTQPMGNLTQLADGSFAGMTRLGGDHETGVLFKYDPLTDEYLVIHQFPPTSYPRGSLVLHENGSLYGMTTGGGPFKSGTIFRIETDGTGYVSLYEFKGDEYPDGALVPHDDGYLYGQANNGGTNDAGYVFRIHEENYTFEKIRDFDKHNKWPVGTPAFDESGKLCLATSSGGLAGYGTVVSMRTDGTELEILHDFSTGLPRSPKGNFLKSGSNYFGTSEVGGDNNLGTIYALSEDSNEVLHSFSGIEGRWPNGFISGPEGRCYGLAGGGSNSLGVLYSFDPEDSTFSVLHHFDNQNCMGQLLISTDQNIYGFTTYKTFRYDLVEGTYEELSNLRTSFNIGPKDIHGAFAEGSDGYLYGMGFDGLGCTDGCIFKTSKDGSEFDIVYDFASHTGNYPYGSLISGSDNKWYGVTSLGGKNGKGVVFSINEDMSNYSVLHHFDETNGSKPRGTLLLRNDHRLYGTTSEGGDYDRGVIFTINADGTGFTKITDLKANYQRYNFSLQAEGNSKPNYLGTSSFEALEDGPGFTIPFNNNFYDDHDNPANLIYGLVSNSNQTLINVSLSDTAFHFDLIPDAFGVAEVILSARDSEDSELQIPVQITINPVADTPVGTEVEVPYGHLTKISDFLQRSGVDGEEVTHLIFWNVKGGTLYLADSVTRVYNGMVMPYNDYQEEGLVFLARAGKDVSFEVRASVSAYHSGKGGDLVNITVRINKAPLTITAKSYSTIYGEILPEFEATYEGFLFSDRILGIENPPTFYIADESNQVGNHEILMSDASDARYEITLVSGTLSITKAQLSVLVDDQVRTYGAENPELTYSYDGFVNGEGATDLESEPEVTTTATEASTVGSYPITSSGGSATNYEFEHVDGTLTVEKATLSVLVDDQVRTYGAANLELTYSYEGFANDEGATDLEAEPEVTTTATEASTVGSYSITSSGGSAINYVFEHTDGTLTVEKATLSVLVDDQVRTYGAENPELTYSYDGFVNGEGATDLESEPEVTTTATEASTVGSYSITSSGGSATNYEFDFTEGTLTVEKAPLSVLADDKVRVYGTANPELTYSYEGFVNGEGATDLESEPEITTIATEASAVGSYSITSSGGSAINYVFEHTNGTLTVEKAPLSLLVDDQVRTYGATNPELTYSYDGFVNSEGATDLEAEPEVTTTATEASTVGSYPITSSGGSATNYAFEYAEGTLTVEKALLSVLVDDQVRTYGAANPELTYSYEGFANDEGTSDLEAEPEITTTATEASTVGSYPITSSGGSATNYAFEYAEGALVIEKALLSVLVDDQTIVYGDAQPTYTWSYSGFVNEEQEGVIDVLPEIVDMGDVKDAGAYVIQVAGGMDDNYMFTFNSGLLVVSKAELQAVIQDVMILQGDAIPAFTVTFQGFKYDDDQTALDVIPSASVDLTDTDTPGTYSIMLAGGLDNNYEFDLQDGVLTIGQILRTQIGDNSLIYPNPTDQFIYVVPGKAKSVEVYNLQGLLVLRSLVTQQIDVSGLSSGIYVIYLKDENRKIISHHKLSKN